MLESDKCTLELLNEQDDKGNTALIIACDNQPDAVKYILDSNKCSIELLNKQDNDVNTASNSACYYQPEAVKYILESDKCTLELLNKRNIYRLEDEEKITNNKQQLQQYFFDYFKSMIIKNINKNKLLNNILTMDLLDEDYIFL